MLPAPPTGRALLLTRRLQDLWGEAASEMLTVQYRMNSRKRLRTLADASGFDEVRFWRLDDCRALARWRLTHAMELVSWRALRAVGLPYPENCLMGIYRRR